MASAREFSFKITGDTAKLEPFSLIVVADETTIAEIENCLLKLSFPIHCHRKGTCLDHDKNFFYLSFHYKAEDIIAQNLIQIAIGALQASVPINEINGLINENLMESSAEQNQIWVTEKAKRNRKVSPVEIPQKNNNEDKKEPLKKAENIIFFAPRPVTSPQNRPATPLPKLNRYNGVTII